MIFSKIKLFGLLALSYSLIACGQTQGSTVPNATPSATSSAIAQTPIAPQATEKPAVVAKSPEPQSTATASGHSLLSASQLESLKSLGIKIAIPQYVPQGFEVAEIKTEPCRDGEQAGANGVCRFRPSYKVVYRNAQNHCFAVDAVGGGVGGPNGVYTRAVNTNILGKVDINVGISGSGEPITDAIANAPQERLWTFPAGNSPFYSMNTCGTEVYMTPNEFIKIVQSLEWLPQSTTLVSSAPSQEEVEENAHRQFDKIANQPCDRQTKDEKSTRYMICSVQGADNKPRVISASSANIEAGDGIGYWFAEDRTVAAIRYFHTGEVFLFSGDRLVASLTPDQKVVANGEKTFQRETASRGFTGEQRKRLQDLAKGRGEDILSRFK